MILVKIPTRERPEQFLDALWRMLYRADDARGLHVIVSLDEDQIDANEVIHKGIKLLGGITSIEVKTSPRVSKVEAVNRDIPQEGWDTLVLMSDDMMCDMVGWDTVIRADMMLNFPDQDGCLWYSDGYNKKICTMPIMGRTYYSRFGYIYHPLYHSLWADNEQTEVAEKLERIYRGDTCLFRHEHPSNNGQIRTDPLYKKNEGYNGRDKLTYVTRRLAGYHLGLPVDGEAPVARKYTQNDEHLWIDMYFGDSPGRVLDIGANDGTTLSNSLALIERGWNAVLVEPSPQAFVRLKSLHSNRALNGQVLLVNAAISDTAGEVTFYESGEHLKKGDVALVSTLSAQERDRWSAGGANSFSEVKVQSVRYADAIPPGSRFDLISIDAEGYDWEILQQIDLTVAGCRMLIVESNVGDHQKFIDYCSGHGMKLKHQNAENLCFVR